MGRTLNLRGLPRPVAFCFSFVILLLLLGLASAQAQTPKRKVIIDNEGFGLTQIMLLGADDVEVIGMTSVSGNVWANRATALILRGLEQVGRPDIPVAQGATYPLLNSEALTDRWEALYGKLTWKGAWMKQWVEPTLQSTPPYFGPNDPVSLSQGNPKLKPLDEAAALFMIRMVRKYPGQITIIEGGPMTNLALAQRLDPEFASLARELVYMGGSLNPQQKLDNRSAAEYAREFVNSPRREFNIRFDPEAASIVSRSPWRKITVIPVDPSTDTQRTRAFLDRLAKASSSPAIAKFFTDREPGGPLWDEIMAAVWIEPTLVTDKETLFVDYNTQFGPGYGDHLSWRAGYQPGVGEQPAEVIRTVDVPRLEALIEKLVANVHGKK